MRIMRESCGALKQGLLLRCILLINFHFATYQRKIYKSSVELVMVELIHGGDFPVCVHGSQVPTRHPATRVSFECQTSSNLLKVCNCIWLSIYESEPVRTGCILLDASNLHTHVLKHNPTAYCYYGVHFHIL